MKKGLFLSFLLCFCVFETSAWIRFREPTSRRKYIQQTPTETLQKCDITKNAFCKLCGDGNASTSDIPMENYTIIDRNTRILAIEVAFQTGIEGYLEFRLCNVTENETMDAIVCRDVTPLLIGQSERWYPSSTQSYAQSRLRLPPELECERCVLQVKYTPGQRSVMADFRFFDCALLNISRPTVDLSSFLTTHSQNIKTNVNLIPGQAGNSVSSQNNEANSMSGEVTRTVNTNNNVNIVPGEAIDDVTSQHNSANTNSMAREITRKLITNANINFVPGRASIDGSSQRNAANSITGQVTRNVITNINLVPRETVDDVTSQQNSDKTNSVTREVIRITNINQVSGEATNDVSSANENSQIREETRNTINTNRNLVSGKSIKAGVSQNGTVNKNTAIRENTNTSTSVSTTPQKTFPTDHAILDEEQMFSNADAVDTRRRFSTSQERRQFGHFGFNSGMFPTRDIDRRTDVNLRHTLTQTTNRNIGRVSADVATRNDPTMVVSPQKDISVASNRIDRVAGVSNIDDAIKKTENFNVTGGTRNDRNVVTDIGQTNTVVISNISGRSGVTTDDVTNGKAAGTGNVQSAKDRDVFADSSKTLTDEKSSATFLEDEMTGGLGSALVATAGSSYSEVTGNQSAELIQSSDLQQDNKPFSAVSDADILSKTASSSTNAGKSGIITVTNKDITIKNAHNTAISGNSAFIADQNAQSEQARIESTSIGHQSRRTQSTGGTGFESYVASTINDRTLVEAITNDATAINRTFVAAGNARRGNIGIGLRPVNGNKLSTSVDITNNFERNIIDTGDSLNKQSIGEVSNTLIARSDINNTINTTGNNKIMSYDNAYYDSNGTNGRQYYDGNNDNGTVHSSLLEVSVTNRTTVSAKTPVRNIDTSVNAAGQINTRVSTVAIGNTRQGGAIDSQATGSAVNMVNEYATETNIGRVNVPLIPTMDKRRIMTDVSNDTNMLVTVEKEINNRINGQHLSVSGTGIDIGYARADVNLSPTNINTIIEPIVGTASEIKQQVITVPENLPVFALPGTGNEPNRMKLRSKSDRYIVRGENVHNSNSAATILDLGGIENQYQDTSIHGSTVDKKIIVHSQNDVISLNSGSVTGTIDSVSTKTAPADFSGNVDRTTNDIIRNDIHIGSGATHVQSAIDQNQQIMQDDLNRIQNNNQGVLSSSAAAATAATTTGIAAESGSSINDMTVRTAPSQNQNLDGVIRIDANVDTYLGQPTITSSVNKATTATIQVLSVNQTQNTLGDISDAPGTDMIQNDKSASAETNTIMANSNIVVDNEVGPVAKVDLEVPVTNIVTNQSMTGRTDKRTNINTLFEGQSFFTDGGKVDNLGGLPVATSERVKSEFKNTGGNLVSTKTQNSEQTWSASNFDIGNTFGASNSLGLVVVDVDMDKSADQSINDRNTVNTSTDTIITGTHTKRTITSVDESQRLTDNTRSTTNENNKESIATKIGNNVIWQVMDVGTGRQAGTNIVADRRVDTGRQSDTNSVVDRRVDIGRQTDSNIVADRRVNIGRQADINIDVDRRVDIGRQTDSNIVADRRVNIGRQADINIDVDRRVDTGRQSDTNIVADRRVNIGRQADISIAVDRRVDIGRQADINIAVDRRVGTGRQANTNIAVDRSVDIGRQTDSNIVADRRVNIGKQADTNSVVNRRVDSDRQADTNIAVDKRITSVSSRGRITKDHLEMMVNGDATLNNIHLRRPINTKAIQGVNEVPEVMPPIDIKVDDSVEMNVIRNNGNINRMPVQSSETVANGGSTINSLLFRTNRTTVQNNDDTLNNPSQISGSTLWDINRVTNDESTAETNRRALGVFTKFGQNSNNDNKVSTKINRISSIQTSQQATGTPAPRYKTVIYNTQPGFITDTRQGSINSTMNAQVLRILEALFLELKAFEDKSGKKDRKIFTANTDKRTFNIRDQGTSSNTVQDRSGSTVTGRNAIHSSYPLFRVHESMLTLPDNVLGTGPIGRSSLSEVRSDNAQRGSNNHLLINRNLAFNGRRGNSLLDQREPIVNGNNLLKAPYDPKPKTLYHVTPTNSAFDGNIRRADVNGLRNVGNELQVPQTSEGVFQSIINVTKRRRNPTDLFSILSNNFASISTGNRPLASAGINTNTQTLSLQPSASLTEINNNNNVINKDSTTDNSGQQTVINIHPKGIKQSVVRASPLMVSPFSGITIDLTKHNDTFLPRGSTRFQNHRIGLQQAPASRPSEGFPPELRQFQITNQDHQVNADSNVAIEGKYFIGHMRRNALGQFEPVYAASSMDAKGIATAETKASPLDTATVQPPSVFEPPSILNDNNVDPTKKYTSSSENTISNTLTLDSRNTLNNNINMNMLSANLESHEVGIITNADTLNENTGSSTQTVQRQFFNQDDLLNTFGISLTANKNTEQSNETITCPEQEIFVCEAVGKNKQVPGMVWWCFSHCKNGFCPIDKCVCRCENTKNIMDKEVLIASNAPSNDNTFAKNKRVKTVVTLTLNGSEKSTVPLQDKTVSDSNTKLKLSSRDGSQMRNDKIINNVADAAFDKQTVRVTSGSLMAQGGQLAVNNNVASSTSALSCTGINAFVNTPGINDWCTAMCSNSVCPVDICNCA